MEILFWIFLGIVFYTYIGYGILLYFMVLIKRLFTKKVKYSYFEPKVTLLVPAYNEEDYIMDKVKNTFELDYPKDKLKIVFITDGSTDDTPKLLSKVEGITLLHQDKRQGKSMAENRAMKYVNTPFVIFCDANTHLNPQAVKELMKHYQNSRVGGVSGEKKIMKNKSDNASGAGEGFYWRYESFLKKMDAELLTIVGAAGELVSFRTELVEDLESDTILDDFVQSVRIAQKGYRFLYEPNAYALETASSSVGEELKRKVRIAAGGWQSMLRLLSVFNFFKHPVLTFLYVSHRVLRWSITPLCLLALFVINLILIDFHSFYQMFFTLQLVFIFMASIGWKLERRNIRLKVLFIPFYFIMMNYAVILGFFRYINQKQSASWERSKRS